MNSIVNGAGAQICDKVTCHETQLEKSQSTLLINRNGREVILIFNTMPSMF